MRHTHPAGAIPHPLYAADASHRADEIDTLAGIDASSICEEWDYARDYCACVRWTVNDRPYSAWMGARAWATSADAPAFVDEWHAGPLTESGAHAREICFRAPSERWWSSTSVVREAMERLEPTRRVVGGDAVVDAAAPSPRK